MSGAGIARDHRRRSGRRIAVSLGLAACMAAAGWASGRPPASVDGPRASASSGEPVDPADRLDAAGPNRRGRSVDRALTPVARRRPTAAGDHRDAGDGGEGDVGGPGDIRLGPGRWPPEVATPGTGVPVEAVVRVPRSAAGPGGSRSLEVVVLTRPHPDLPWTRIPMRPLATDAERFQAVIPCAPCHARPEFRFEAVVRAGDASGIAPGVRWPAAADPPSRYDVGHERVRSAGGGAVLRRAAGSRAMVGRAVTPPAEAWRSPVWSIAGSADPIFAARWSPLGGSSRLVLAVRAGTSARWTVLRTVPRPPIDPRTPWVAISEAVRRHVGSAEAVQVAIWVEGDAGADPGGGRLLRPRLLEIRCTPPTSPDVDGDGLVGLADLLLVFEAFGPCEPGAACPADVDGDGLVDLTDVLLVVAAWGTDGTDGTG